MNLANDIFHRADPAAPALIEATRTTSYGDLDAWTAAAFEDCWQCTYCHAEGADINDEPREADHKPDCPWLLARGMLGLRRDCD